MTYFDRVVLSVLTDTKYADEFHIREYKRRIEKAVGDDPENIKQFCIEDLIDSADKSISLDTSIKEIEDMRLETGMSQKVYIIEECGELLQAMMKEERGKGNTEHIKEEVCDLISTLLVYMYKLCRTPFFMDAIYTRIMSKYVRALERYKKGEI